LAVIQSIIVIFEGSAGLGKRDGLNNYQISLILKVYDILYRQILDHQPVNKSC